MVLTLLLGGFFIVAWLHSCMVLAQSEEASGEMVLAATVGPTVQPTLKLTEKLKRSLTPTVEATPTAGIATPSATPTIVKTEAKLTEPTVKVKSRLERVLESQEIGQPGVINFLKYQIRAAVERGVPLNTIVLLLLLPLSAALIGMIRYLVGVQVFGIFAPVILAIAFLNTGVLSGLILLLVILLMSNLSRLLLVKLHIHYLPRMSLLIWFVSMTVMAAIFLSPLLNLPDMTTISIFAVLMMILLAENFMEVQIGKSLREAVSLTLTTILLSLACYFLMSWQPLQEWVLLNPEVTVSLVFVVNFLIGRYTGFRLWEYQRFREVFRS